MSAGNVDVPRVFGWGAAGGNEHRCPLCGDRDYYPEADSVRRWLALRALAGVARSVLAEAHLPPGTGETYGDAEVPLANLEALRAALADLDRYGGDP